MKQKLDKNSEEFAEKIKKPKTSIKDKWNKFCANLKSKFSKKRGVKTTSTKTNILTPQIRHLIHLIIRI